MPNPINLTELLADREAGTSGEWRVDPQWPADIQDAEGYEIGSIFESRNVGEEWLIAGPVRADEGEALANARRIARLPDLEAAYIEAVELLRDMIEEEDIGVDLYQRARKFLGDEE